MTSLLDDLEEYRMGNVKVPPSRKEKIEAELKLLEWHKMANSAAIKAALLQTKSTKQSSPVKKPNHKEDDSRWIKKVIQQEHIKPLEVSKDFVLNYEKSEKENAERLTSQVNRHITTLKTLRVKLEARQDLKERTEEYRQWQKGFLPKKHAVLNGKTLDELDPSALMIGNNGNNDRRSQSRNNTLNRSGGGLTAEDENHEMTMAKAAERKAAKQGQGSNQELSTVLDSLSRLAELENRITSLEKENQYDNMLSMERPSANQRTSVEFIKKRGAADERGPVGMVYEVRSKQDKAYNKNWKVSVPNRGPSAGGGIAAIRGRQQQQQQGGYSDFEGTDGGYNSSVDGDGGHGPGIFITADDTGGRGEAAAKRDALRKERQRQLALASQGQKQLRARVQLKKGRQQEKMMGARKHEDAMRELARRKVEQSSRKAASNRANAAAGGGAGSRLQVPKKGIASGVRNKSKHMQDFERLKQNNRKRTEDIQRGQQKQVPRPPLGGPDIRNRFVSQTAPAYNNSNHPQYRGGRAPTTRVGGTVTRRTDNPTRRVIQGSDGPLYASVGGGKVPLTAPPVIAVTGVGGLRALRATNNSNNHNNARNQPVTKKRMY